MVNRKYTKDEVYLHRILIGAKKGEIVDHINRNKLDNRIENLRIVTQSQNNLNRKVSNPLGFAGIRKVGNKIRAFIHKNDKQIHLGYFFTVDEAVKARRIAYEQRF